MTVGALDGKVAIVTGAASGIGAAIAAAYAAEGALLMLADRNASGLQQQAHACQEIGAKVVTCEVDVTDERSTRHLVDRAISELGGLHVLVNCAGILTEVPLAEMDAATWGDTIASQLGVKGGESLA